MNKAERIGVTTAAALAVALIPATAPHTETLPPRAIPAHEPEGRTYVDSTMQYNGADAPYLLAADCNGAPGAMYYVEVPVPRRGDSSPLTVGATVENNVDPLSSNRMQRANFLGGITFTVREDGAVEFVRSDDVVAGLATRIDGGFDNEYIGLSGPSDLKIDFGVTPGNETVHVSIECIPDMGFEEPDTDTMPLSFN